MARLESIGVAAMESICVARQQWSRSVQQGCNGVDKVTLLMAVALVPKPKFAEIEQNFFDFKTFHEVNIPDRLTQIHTSYQEIEGEGPFL